MPGVASLMRIGGQMVAEPVSNQGTPRRGLPDAGGDAEARGGVGLADSLEPGTDRLIVWFLGLTVILVVLLGFATRLIGIFSPTAGGDLPDSMVGIGSGAIGALAGFLGQRVRAGRGRLGTPSRTEQ